MRETKKELRKKKSKREKKSPTKSVRKNIAYIANVRPCAMVTVLKKEGKACLHITTASKLMPK